MCNSLSSPQIEQCTPAANWCSHPGGVGSEVYSKQPCSCPSRCTCCGRFMTHCVHVHVYLMIITDSCRCVKRNSGAPCSSMARVVRFYVREMRMKICIDVRDDM